MLEKLRDVPTSFHQSSVSTSVKEFRPIPLKYIKFLEFSQKIKNFQKSNILRFVKNHMSNPKVSEFDNQSVELEGWVESQLSSNTGCPYGKSAT